MDKVINYLQLARKSGKLIIGTDMVLSKLSKRKTYLIFLATDASVATIERVEKKGRFYQIPVIKKYPTIEFAQSLGLGNIKVLGLNDYGFAKAIIKELESEGD